MRPVVLEDPRSGDQTKAWLCSVEHMPLEGDAFAEALAQATKLTGMDEMRLAVLWLAVRESRHCEAGELIEVGCGTGGSGLLIASAMKAADITEPLTLVDTFRGIVKSAAMDLHKDGEMNDSTRAATAELLGDRARVVQAVFPDEFDAGHTRYRFAHIDVDTYTSALESFRDLWPRMVRGAMLVIDDYGIGTTPGIKLAVDQLDLPDARWVFALSCQAVAVKL